MKIKDKNELKGMSEVIVTIPDELIEKYKNREVLSYNNTLFQLYGIPIHKNNIDLIEKDLKRSALVKIAPRINEFLTEELIDGTDDFAFVSRIAVPVNEDENDFKVAVYSEPTLTYNYKDLEKPEPFQGLFDDEKKLLIDRELKELQKKNARLTPLDRPYEEGDVVSIIEAGEGESIETKKSEILFPEDLNERPTLKENLIGKSVDDTFSYEPFNNTTVKVIQVYESDIDELDDDFASEVSEFDTLDELKNFIVETEENKLKDQYLEEQKNNVLLQFVNSIEIADVDNSLMEYVNNHTGVNETNVSLFMDGFLTDNQDNAPLTEYFEKLIQYIYDLILKEENIETNEVIENIIQNWDSEEFDDEYKKQLALLKNYRGELSKELLNESIAEIIKANKVREIIYKYSLDSEN